MSIASAPDVDCALKMRTIAAWVKCASCMKSMRPCDFRPPSPARPILMERRESRLLSRWRTGMKQIPRILQSGFRDAQIHANSRRQQCSTLKTKLAAATIAVASMAASQHRRSPASAPLRAPTRSPMPRPMPKDVTDTVIGAVNLGSEIGVDGRQLRTRRLVVQPGGIVPLHSHKDRPALIYTLSGSITEYSSTCSVPIEHEAGDISREADGLSHYWINHGKVPTVLLSSDVFHGHVSPPPAPSPFAGTSRRPAFAPGGTPPFQ